MSESVVELKALTTFVKSIGRPVNRWPYRRARETRLHRQWRAAASIVHRFRLYADAGLPIEPGMTKAFWDAEDAERVAHRAMIEEKHRREMDFLTGKRKSAPPWGY